MFVKVILSMYGSLFPVTGSLRQYSAYFATIISSVVKLTALNGPVPIGVPEQVVLSIN